MEVILPKIESTVMEMLESFAEENAQGLKSEDLQALFSQQFRQAMQATIMPDLAKITTKMMETIERKLSQVDAALCSKLQEEAERAERFQMQ